MNLKIWKCD